MKAFAALVQSSQKIVRGWSVLQNTKTILQRTNCQDVMRYSTIVDTRDRFGSGMYAANGYSLYLSENTILHCVELRCKQQSAHVPMTIADFGTADGRTSLSLLNKIIDTIHTHSGNAKPIMIYHEDQPGNDFNLLSQVIQGTADEGDTGLNKTPSVFHATIGRNMYEQCLPNNSIDITFSSIAAQYLSRRPCRLEGGIIPSDGNEAERALLKEQSAKDWARFLYVRGRELAPGGYMVVLNIGTYKEGHELIAISGGSHQFGKLSKSMLEDGLITHEEFLDTNFDVDFERTEEDHSLPFIEKDERLMELGLELVAVRSMVNRLEHPTFDIVDKEMYSHHRGIQYYATLARPDRDTSYYRFKVYTHQSFQNRPKCQDVMRYSTMVDTRDKFGSGMYAANGYSLYLSQDTILDCVEHRCKQQSAHVPMAIADFGTADGRTSLVLFNNIIDTIHTHSGTGKPIMIYHEDQPGNDFNLLSQVIQGTADEGSTGLNITPNVFHATIGRNMYEQCLPNNSVDIAFSSIAQHNLSRRPCRIQGGVLSCDGNEEERALVNEQSDKDWTRFLYVRGRELAPGGYLVVLNCGIDRKGHGCSYISGDLPQLGKLYKAMLEDGLITHEEFLDANFDVDFERTEEDHSRPFTEKDERLMDLGLELVSVRSMVNRLEHPTFDIVDKDAATTVEYSERIVAGITPWFHHVIYNGLSDRRPEEERQTLTNIYFERIREFAYNNHDYRPQVALVETVVRKRL